MAKSPEPYVVKTHDLPKDDAPAIYLVRDGRDALISYAWWTLSSESKTETKSSSKPFLDLLEDFIISKEQFGGWGSNVLAWTRRPQTHVLKFEDLIQYPKKKILEALASLDLEPKENKRFKIPSFKKLQADDPKLYRKGQIGGWKADMSAYHHELFWEYHGEAMQALDYSR